MRKQSAGELVTFVVDRNINYTTYVLQMQILRILQEPDAKDAYVLTIEEILEKVDEAVKLGATQILLQGGLNPELTIEYYENMLRRVKKNSMSRCMPSRPPRWCTSQNRMAPVSGNDIPAS